MALSSDDIFIPLPAREASSNTPILKWVLSRPNTHLFPLHLLTTSRSLDVVNEEIVGYEEDSSFDGDVTSSSDDVSSRDDVSIVSEKAEEEGEKMEGPEQSPHNILSTPLDNVLPQNPHNATSTMMDTMGGSGLRAPLLLPPVSSIFPPPLPPLQLIQMTLRQQMLMQNMQQPILQPMGMMQYLPTEPLYRPPRQQGMMHYLREEEDIDVVGGVERHSREYTPVLPPTPVYDPLPNAIDNGDVVNDEQQISMRLPTQRPQSLSVVSSRVHRPAAVAGVAAAAAAAVSATRRKSVERQSRLVLTARQRDFFSAVFARVTYLWPTERETIATAFGISKRQVLNVFINRGGRASQRRTVGMSMDEANGIIREELLKFGFSVNGDEENKKE